MLFRDKKFHFSGYSGFRLFARIEWELPLKGRLFDKIEWEPPLNSGFRLAPVARIEWEPPHSILAFSVFSSPTGVSQS